MIHVAIYQNRRKEYIGFKASGHAGFGESGKDIVCAAASILMINTINAVELYTSDRTSLFSDEEIGLIDYCIEVSPSEKAEVLLKAMVLGLREIADDENYAEYIDLTFEEV